MTLADYLTRVRRLLHDANATYWSDTDLTDYINRGRTEVAARCKNVRQLQTPTLVAGPDPSTVAYASLPNPNVVDVLSIALIDGNFRYVLQQRSYAALVAQFRPYTSFQSRPMAFARYGFGVIYFAPAPTINYPTEWDTAVLPADLPVATPTTVESMVYPFTEPVAYYAAYQAKINYGEHQEAERFRTMFERSVMETTQKMLAMHTPDQYADTEGLPW